MSPHTAGLGNLESEGQFTGTGRRPAQGGLPSGPPTYMLSGPFLTARESKNYSQSHAGESDQAISLS